MKKVILILACALLFCSCEKEPVVVEKPQTDSVKTPHTHCDRD